MSRLLSDSPSLVVSQVSGDTVDVVLLHVSIRLLQQSLHLIVPDRQREKETERERDPNEKEE